MSTLAERLNNAIVALDYLAPASPRGVKLAITELAQHWLAFWGSSERTLLPPLALGSKLQRYAAWYARAWSLVPPDVRAQAPDPRELDATTLALVEDQLRAMAEGAQASAAAGKELKTYLGEQASALRSELTSSLAVVAVMVVAVLVAYAYAKRS